MDLVGRKPNQQCTTKDFFLKTFELKLMPSANSQDTPSRGTFLAKDDRFLSNKKINPYYHLSLTR